MGTILNSVQHLSFGPFNRDDIPLVQRTQPQSLRTISQASKQFLSLVAFVKAGNNLDDTATRKACTLLQNILPEFNQKSSAEQILFKLVPMPDGSCSGFAESIVLLLTSSNEKVIQATLLFLHRVVIEASSALVDFMETGFFNLLPQAFYEQEVHLCAHSGLYLTKIVTKLVSFTKIPHSYKLCSYTLSSLDTFYETFTNQFLRPIRPFLDFVCKNRRRINEILQYSPFLEETTQFALSSSFAVAFTDSRDFFKPNILTHTLLHQLRENYYLGLNYQNTPLQTRGIRIMAKLCEEGLSDEIELHFRTSGLMYDQPDLFLGMQLIALKQEVYSKDGERRCEEKISSESSCTETISNIESLDDSAERGQLEAARGVRKLRLGSHEGPEDLIGGEERS
ncbi:hypothetical protein BLNAU_9900 [Blattamonas nauphoetae]|uniref:Uncharacterized protein n=1 Tax=Blattamonas nauphoetae TaxID=2049346 RepID=A0ABQ9XUM8_9EUKA|nr:hypothetical protein BLNAU_9900 [Blattamonas nauphoetae]